MDIRNVGAIFAKAEAFKDTVVSGVKWIGHMINPLNILKPLEVVTRIAAKANTVAFDLKDKGLNELLKKRDELAGIKKEITILKTSIQSGMKSPDSKLKNIFKTIDAFVNKLLSRPDIAKLDEAEATIIKLEAALSNKIKTVEADPRAPKMQAEAEEVAEPQTTQVETQSASEAELSPLLQALINEPVADTQTAAEELPKVVAEKEEKPQANEASEKPATTLPEKAVESEVSNAQSQASVETEKAASEAAKATEAQAAAEAEKAKAAKAAEEAQTTAMAPEKAAPTKLELQTQLDKLIKEQNTNKMALQGLSGIPGGNEDLVQITEKLNAARTILATLNSKVKSNFDKFKKVPYDIVRFDDKISVDELLKPENGYELQTNQRGDDQTRLLFATLKNNHQLAQRWQTKVSNLEATESLLTKRNEHRAKIEEMQGKIDETQAKIKELG